MLKQIRPQLSSIAHLSRRLVILGPSTSSLFSSHGSSLVLAMTMSNIDALKTAKIIPDVLPKVLDSSEKLVVTFGPLEASKGQQIPPPKASSEPSIMIDGAASGALYTLVMSDPDAPSPTDPKMREWLHWIVSDIPEGDIKKGSVRVPYNGPTPPRGSHRYVFTLYRQQGPGAIPHSFSVDGRGRFRTAEFAAKYRLGDAVAAAWFMAAPPGQG